MTNEDVLEELTEIKAFCGKEHLEAIEYVIDVFEKLKKEGVEKPLDTDFTKLKNCE